ncbi:MAG: selenocysteine-specific translation elongation factor [Armatimonadota bacterium]
MAYLLGTAGHVDHGKTTLLAALTGIDADRLPEEKARGMTIDLGFAWIDLPDAGRVSIVDVPGHERFIKNMLAGASGVDVALLCVASNEGVMPQTREHFQILRLLEARSLVVALTKCDMTDEEEQEIAELDVRDLLSGTPFEGAPILRVSAQTGQGVEELKAALAETLRSLGDRPMSEKDWFLPIDRVFTVAGHGTVVTGTLARGKISVGVEAEVLPGNLLARVRSIQVHGHPADVVEAGRRTAINLTGVKREDLHRGQAVAAPGCLAETQILNVRLTSVAELKHGQRIRLHIGSGEFIGKLFLFDHAPGFGQLRVETPVACARGQRAVLRRYSPPDLLAGAEVITPNATKRRKNDRSVAELLAGRAEGDDADRICAELARHSRGIETRHVCEALGATPQALGDSFERLLKAGRAKSFAGMWVADEHLGEVAQVVAEALARLHERNPSQPAIAKSTLLAETKIGWNPKAFDRLIQHLHEEGAVALHAGGVRLPDFRVQLSEKQEELLERLLKVMERAGAAAPSVADVANELRVPPQAVEEMIRLGLSSGKVVKVDEGLVYSAKTIEQLKQKAREIGPRFTAAAFRDATGSSRKYAIAILEHFDSIRFTRRVGDERVIVE